MSIITTSTMSPARAQYNIQKGLFRPHTVLGNMAMAYFQDSTQYFARAMFPTCRVQQSADRYYVFDKEDLLRSGWQKKPSMGQVMPTVVSEHTDTYSVDVYQMIMGLDEIRQTDIDRRGGPQISKPEYQQTRVIAHHSDIFKDRMFVKKFFSPDVWKDEWTGVDNTTPGDKEFIKFSNDNSDPIAFIDEQKWRVYERTGRMPNRLGIGVDVLKALRKHPAIKERVLPGGATSNPARITESVLQQLFEVDKVVVMHSIHNAAEMGELDNIGFIANTKSMLLTYAPSAPSTSEPSAGYIFQWDMLGNGQLMPMFHRKPNDARHVEELEAMMAFDMRKTADDLAVFFKDVV